MEMQVERRGRLPHSLPVFMEEGGWLVWAPPLPLILNGRGGTARVWVPHSLPVFMEEVGRIVGDLTLPGLPQSPASPPPCQHRLHLHHHYNTTSSCCCLVSQTHVHDSSVARFFICNTTILSVRIVTSS